jgi:DinB superfamily
MRWMARLHKRLAPAFTARPPGRLITLQCVGAHTVMPGIHGPQSWYGLASICPTLQGPSMENFMRLTPRLGTLACLLLVLIQPLGAQTREGVMGDLMKDVKGVQDKIVGLAKAMPESAYAWRPGKGARSTGEVLLHVASDNYFLPAVMGIAPPASTGINGKDYKTTEAFEKRTLTRDQIIAELEKSFAFLQTSMAGMPDAKLNAPLDAFGEKTTNRGLWLSTTTHLHEHLGQLIAYARSNNVTPPWSK